MKEPEYYEKLFDREYIRLGVMIGKLRVEKGYSEDTISRGLCSRQMLQKIESGNSDPDIRLLRMLISRLGKSPNKLEYIISRKTYRILLMQKEFDDYIKSDDRNGAERILNTYKGACEIVKKQESNIFKIYYLRNRAVYEYYICHDRKTAAKTIEECCKISFSSWKDAALKPHRISTTEIENMLAYVELRHFDDDDLVCKSDLHECELILEKISEYISTEISDEEEQAYIIPKLRWLQAKMYVCKKDYQTAVLSAENGLSHLRKYAILYFSRSLLKIIVKYGKECILDEPYENYEKYLYTINRIINDYGDTYFNYDNIFISCDRSSYYADWEILKAQRVLRNIKREEMVEGIYENVETLSRVESGKVSPNKTTLPKIMKKLRLEWSRNNTSLISRDFNDLERLENIHLMLSNGLNGQTEIERVEKAINELSFSIPLNISRNRRIINGLKNEVAFWKALNENIDEKKELLIKIIKAEKENLSDVYPIWEREIARAPLSDEISAVLLIEGCYYKAKEKEKALDLCQRTMKAYKNSAIDGFFNCRWYGVQLVNYSQFSKDNDLSKKALAFILSVGSLDNSDRVLYNISTQLYRKNHDKEETAKSMSIALNMARFLNSNMIISAIDTCIEKFSLKLI